MSRTKLPLSVDTIPKPLQDIPHWVVWKFEERGSKQTKVLYQPNYPTKKAKVNDARTWGTFSEAVHTYQTNAFAGVGFVFSQNDPFTGIDLDKCRDAKTGTLELWAQQIVESLNSYGEVSPSSTGVHVILEAQLPEGRRRKDRIEMYDHARFFCMTGHHLTSTPNTIEPRQGELDVLHACHRVFGC